MRMVRISIILLVLTLQITAVVSPYGFVLCVHDDGRRMLEPVWATCCRTEEAGNTCCSDVPSRQTTAIENQTQEDSCKDYPLSSLDAQFPQESNRNESKDKGSPFVFSHVPIHPINTELNTEFRGYIGYFDPLAAHTQLTHIRTIVLHC